MIDGITVDPFIYHFCVPIPTPTPENLKNLKFSEIKEGSFDFFKEFYSDK